MPHTEKAYGAAMKGMTAFPCRVAQKAFPEKWWWCLLT